MPNFQPKSIPDTLDLDLENKLVNPSLELYQSLKLFSTELYQDTRETLINTHNKVSELGTQFYNHPVETTTELYGQAANLGSETLASIDRQLIPEIISFYNTGTRELTILGAEWSDSFKRINGQTIEFCKTFYSHPTETLNLIYSDLQKGMGSLTDYTVEIFNQAAAAVAFTYQSLIAALNMFIDKPKAVAQVFYYDVISGLLDLYVQLINFTLKLLGNSVQLML